MKKIISVLLCTALAVSLSACSNGSDNSGSISTPSSGYENSGSSSPSSTPNGDITNTLNNRYNVSDGTYRGAYIDPTELEVSFSIRDGKFESIDFLSISTTANAARTVGEGAYRQLADHLVGKEISSVEELYDPTNILDDYDPTGTDLSANKLISAINDGLGRGVFMKDTMSGGQTPGDTESSSSEGENQSGDESQSSSEESSK